MSYRILFLGLVLVSLVGAGEVSARQGVAASTPTVATTTATSTRRPMPTQTPTPVVTPTRMGPFVVSHWIGVTDSKVLPPVEIPSWVRIPDVQGRALAQIEAQYEAWAQADEIRAQAEYAAQVIALSNDFLLKYPNTDGVIPVLMMLGNAQNFYIASGHGQTATLLGQEYRQAIQLLMRQHSERIPNLIDDLKQMGMPISQLKFANLDSHTQVLFFAYQFSPPGQAMGELYALLNEQGRGWQFTTVPIHYAKTGLFNATIGSIQDLNDDGRMDILVELESSYADGVGRTLNLFTLQDGEWVDGLAWGLRQQDAFNGNYWFEDLNQDHIQEIVVEHHVCPALGGCPETIEIYQWDKTLQKYVSTLPIESQLCGYHALAEAERRFGLGDYDGAIPWYQETRKRWLAEMEQPNAKCTHRPKADSYNIDHAFLKQMQGQDEISKTNRIVGKRVWESFPAIQNSAASETRTLTQSVVTQHQFADIYKCDTPECRVIARYFLAASYQNVLNGQSQVRCETRKHPNDEGYNLAFDATSIIQSSDWNCSVREPSGKVLGEWKDIQIVNVCDWDTRRFRQKGYRVVGFYYKREADYDAYRRVRESLPELAGLVDCSGDAP